MAVRIYAVILLFMFCFNCAWAQSGPQGGVVGPGPGGTGGVTFSGTPSAGYVPIATGTTSAAWLASRPQGDVRNYGAKCDGTTDDSAAILSAIASGVLSVKIPAGLKCISAAAITLTAGVSMSSDTNPLGNPSAGGQLLCTSAVTTACLTLSSGTSGASGVGSIEAHDLAVGYTGTPAAGAIAIKVATTYDPLLYNLLAVNAPIGYEFVGTGIYGISARMHDIETCGITDAHLVIDGWPELRISRGRFGCNNDISAAANDFIRLQNTAGGPSNTPNTITIENSQFNMGGGQAGCWLRFVGITSTKNEYTFIGNHAEGVSVGMCSDVTTTSINVFKLIGNTFLDNSGSHPFFSLNAASTINDWQLVGNQFNGWTSWTLAPTAQINALTGTTNRWNGPVVNITGVSNSTVSLADSSFGGISLSGSFATSKFSGVNTAGSISNTATGPIQLGFSGTAGLTSFTPALLFGGASTGITYSSQSGSWQLASDVVTYTFTLNLSSKGSATGAATLSGFPLTGTATRNAANILYNAGMVGLVGAVMVTPAAAGTANLYQQGSGGIGQLFDTNFTNTSAISGTLTWFQ